MKKLTFPLLFIFTSFTAWSQVGIGTTNPQGALDVASTNTAFIAPRVTSLEDVTNGS